MRRVFHYPAPDLVGMLARKAHLLEMTADKFKSPAAWLTFTHRAQVRKTGSIEFRVPVGHQAPGWLSVAFAEFLMHGRTWSAEKIITSTGDLVLRVKWLKSRFHTKARA